MKAIQKLSVFMVMIVSLILCSCRTAQPNELQPSLATQFIEPIAPTVAETFYSNLLKDYENIVSFRLSEDFEANWNNGCYPPISDELAHAIQSSPNAEWSNMVVEMVNGIAEPDDSSFGYIEKDINGDDFPELFWVRSDYSILAIFTKNNEQLVLIDAFWSQHACIITNRNEMYTKTSGGAAYMRYTIQKIDVSGSTFQIREFGMDGFSADAAVQYYEIIENQKKFVSSEDFDELLRTYPFEIELTWLSNKLILLSTT